ncbi:hypothetical protein [Streptomyces niveus]|uniref:hypothetical protein n=1 Tax=Streptomyces niveus TaxID=193462 RepID=UPI00386A68CF
MTTLPRRLAGAPGGSRGKWFVLLAWLILAVALGPLAGKLGEVEETGPNAFLPRGAESAKVNTELEKFRTDTLMPAVVVYTGEGAAAKAGADRPRLTPLVAEGEQLPPAVRSDDGKALMVVVPASVRRHCGSATRAVSWRG